MLRALAPLLVLFASGLSMAAERGRDPWVFRSVLDGRPRIATLALSPELWVAYDTERGALVRAWRGAVVFDGPVYNEVHGPQPISEGVVLQRGGPPAPWSLERADRSTPLELRYRGHRFEGTRAWLALSLRAGDGTTIEVSESPERIGDPSAPDLERRFRITDLPEGATLVLGLPAPAAHVVLEAEGAELASGRSASLRFARDGEATLVARFDDARIAEPPAGPRELDDEARFARSFQQHGCQSCHASDARTTGPSLVEIAQRYPWTHPVREQLAWKVATGGSGSFGEVAMTPHPELSEETRLALVDGILALDGEPAPGPDGSGLTAGQRFERRAMRTVMRAMASVASFYATVIEPWGETPGDGIRLDGVHPSFDLERARPLEFLPRVGGMDFFSDGRLALCTWDPDGAVYLLEGVLGDEPDAIRVKRIASGLAEPLGLVIVDDLLYVLQKQELTQLLDHDGDDRIDEYRSVSNDWGVSANFHEFAFGLAHRDGRVYAGLATAVLPGGKAAPAQPADRGSVIEVTLEDGATRRVAHGLRTPNGIGHGPFGRIWVTDNEGDWLPSSKVLARAEGAFYGSRAVDPEGTESLAVTPPVAWLPHFEIGNSPSQPVPLSLGPYQDQLLFGDVTHGGIKRLFVEEVEGVLQGAVMRFTQGFEAGVNRLVWGPDGKLYAGGIGNPGNWNTPGKGWEGLQRLAWNGRSTFEILAVRARHDGFEIELTEPLADDRVPRPSDLALTTWRYEPTADYGGPKIDPAPVVVRAVSLSEDRRRIQVATESLTPDRVVHLRLVPEAFEDASGARLWSTEAWVTLNRVPGSDAGAGAAQR